MCVLRYYSQHIINNFFVDKYVIRTTYSIPRFCKVYLNVPFSKNFVLSKNYLYKLLIYLYCITGKKPFITIKKLKLKGKYLRKKKITNIALSLRGASMLNVLLYIITRQVPLLKNFKCFLCKKIDVFSFKLLNAVKDEDLLLQILQFNDTLQLHVSITLTPAMSSFKFKDFFRSFKFPLTFSIK